MKEGQNRETVTVAETASGMGPLDLPPKGSFMRKDGVLKICAWCRRIPLGPNHWVHVEEVPLTLEFFPKNMVGGATHGVCPDCFHDFLSGRQTQTASG